MEKRKVKVLIPWTPEGFSHRVMVERNGKPVIETRFDICKPGDVIEIPADVAERAMGRIVGPASAHDKVTKVAQHGALIDAKSGTEKQNTVPAKADEGN